MGLPHCLKQTLNYITRITSMKSANKFLLLTLILLLGLLCTRGVAQSTITLQSNVATAEFQKVQAQVDEFVEKHGSSGVLVVVDIDNTLLAMNQDLGSDQWFNWQENLLQYAPDSADLVAKDFAGLLEVQGTIFSLSAMHPPEPNLPKYIQKIQATDARMVVLTSRGYNFRDAAERELKRNGFDFGENALEIQERRGLFMPFDPDHPEAHGLNAKIIQGIESRLRPVTYSNGIYMTAGQHKGYMLRTLLARSNAQDEIKAVVFVDDHEKHTKRMMEALQDQKMDIAVFHYTREAGNVDKFHNSSKRHVVNDWNQLKEFIDGVLVK